MISNCSHDENGRYSGGKPGDQTGTEYCVRPWYDRPWNCVLRYPKREVGEKLAVVARAAAKNEHIGYNQSRRGTYFYQLRKAGWHAARVNVDCEADCSSSTCANIVAVGHRLGYEKLAGLNPMLTTSTMRSALKNAGFTVLTDEKYTKRPDYLLPGDVLLYEGHHTAINLDKGSKVK